MPGQVRADGDQGHRAVATNRDVAGDRAFSREMSGSNACAVDPVRAHCGLQISTRFLERADMTGAIPALSRRLRPVVAAICLGAASVLAVGAGLGARSRRHCRRRREGDRRRRQYFDLADRRSQGRRRRQGAMPQLPPGSPFEEFFDDFFKNRRGPGRRPRAATRTATCSRARPIRSAPASSSTLRVSSSPTITSSRMPTRSTSS